MRPGNPMWSRGEVKSRHARRVPGPGQAGRGEVIVAAAHRPRAAVRPEHPHPGRRGHLADHGERHAGPGRRAPGRGQPGRGHGDAELVVLAAGERRAPGIGPAGAGGAGRRRPRQPGGLQRGPHARGPAEVAEVLGQAVGEVDGGAGEAAQREPEPEARLGAALAAAQRAAAPGSSPSAASPSVPETSTRSPARAPSRRSAWPRGTSPTTVTVSESSAARVTLPPTTARPCCRAQRPSPRAIPSQARRRRAGRHPQRQQRPERPRPHGGQVGEVDRQRLPADVAGREAVVEVDPLDDGVDGGHQVLAAPGPEQRGVVAGAEQHPLAAGRQRREKRVDELELAEGPGRAH